MMVTAGAGVATTVAWRIAHVGTVVTKPEGEDWCEPPRAALHGVSVSSPKAVHAAGGFAYAANSSPQTDLTI